MRGLPACATGAAAALWLLAAPALSPAAAADSPAAAQIAELRHAFTLDGKPVPPEIFRDFGDGDMADSGSIWVTVDLKAAIGSNLYFDPITTSGRWVSQTKLGAKPGSGGSAYEYIGTADNGLFVVLTAWSGGGSGEFMSLHILDLAPARGFGIDGKAYLRLDLTDLRTVILGDRWNGEIHIAKNTITIVTTRSGPADDSGARRTTTIEAIRP
jgi:hypothetical protein